MKPLKTKRRRNLKPLSPAEARCTDSVCTLKRDNFDAGNYWILTDGYNVTVAAQKLGEPATAMVTVPRAMFTKLARWYLRPQARYKS